MLQISGDSWVRGQRPVCPCSEAHIGGVRDQVEVAVAAAVIHPEEGIRLSFLLFLSLSLSLSLPTSHLYIEVRKVKDKAGKIQCHHRTYEEYGGNDQGVNP